MRAVRARFNLGHLQCVFKGGDCSHGVKAEEEQLAGLDEEHLAAVYP